MPEYIFSTEQAGRNCKIILVHPDDLSAVWDRVVDHIQKCAPHSEGELDSADFYISLSNAQMQLWLLIVNDEVACVAVTQIIPYPKKNVLRILALGGEPFVWKKYWEFALSKIEDFAMEMGCTSLEAWTRRAFLKILKDWKSSYSVITKDLTKRMH